MEKLDDRVIASEVYKKPDERTKLRVKLNNVRKKIEDLKFEEDEILRLIKKLEFG